MASKMTFALSLSTSKMTFRFHIWANIFNIAACGRCKVSGPAGCEAVACGPPGGGSFYPAYTTHENGIANQCAAQVPRGLRSKKALPT
jgi:hypothetical protein